MRAQLIARVDQQRAVPGLALYRPLCASEEQPSFVN
jgi:hypothetical protein